MSAFSWPFRGSPLSVTIRNLGLREYSDVFDAMKTFTQERTASTLDEIWFVEHPPVYTLGLSANREHVLDAGSIPVVKADRGGQVTYHGPGQLIAYVLLDLRRSGMSIKSLVYNLEQAIIDLLAQFGIRGARRSGAPGVYVDGRKIAALGLRVKRGRSYHGLALNVDLDTGPFNGINPCGYPGLPVTRLRDFGIRLRAHQAAPALSRHLLRRLGYRPGEPAGWCPAVSRRQTALV